MRSSTLVTAALSLLPASLASPLATRDLAVQDANTLQLALYLENLEYAFYQGAYNKFTQAQFTAAGFASDFRSQIERIALQENTHKSLLASVLTANKCPAIKPCTYDFPYTNPASFVALANQITTTGIGAYIGGAQFLTDNDAVLTTAATILGVESRHDAYLRDQAGALPFPSAYETPLSAKFAYSIASMFVVSCPAYPPGVTALPKLTITSPASQTSAKVVVPGGTVYKFKVNPTAAGLVPGKAYYIAILQGQDIDFVKVQNLNCAAGTGSFTLPQGLSNIAFAVLTESPGPLTLAQLSNNACAGPALLVIS